MPKLTIDGAEYQVAEGRTVLQAIDERRSVAVSTVA